MLKIVNFMTITIITTVLIVGCRSTASSDVTVTFLQDGDTFETGEFHTFEVRLTDEIEEPIEVDNLQIHINMERMNHPMTGTMTMDDEGTYSVELPLAMEGEWYVDVTALLEDEESIERFYIQAEGEMAEDYMRGFDADKGEVPNH
ncbi:FixH family protein [Salipaludibacillus agaradhaerens]|uniref:FixH family protein n=1 Tax=Salipaludibacillus agaradhaerens TaxID=76935 RepID=A0A9Q4FYG7_SALAG|nr:FixH family protein [Salipaludibacillus agaradhaerens]MCR6095718.1 FixH family protein [Salipaludibacillus agaradhaerens]MCR6114722.1 FixH family protein [Salipaludibacillus agaradhaerens]